MSHERTPETDTSPSTFGVERGPAASPALILVAEDNRLSALLMREQLRLLGYSAEIASSGSEALARWRSGGFAALLTDIQMPGMDGFELTKKVREEEGGATRIPIIALTANAPGEQAVRWRTVGMDDYLTKPTELSALKATLERWVTRRDVGASPQSSQAAR